MSFAFKERLKVLETSDYLVELDEYRNESANVLLFIHLRVDHWSHKVLKELLKHWKAFQTVFTYRPILAIENEDNPHWEQFVSLMGFKYLQDTISVDGKTRKVFIHL